jgi:hypothetical protein
MLRPDTSPGNRPGTHSVPTDEAKAKSHGCFLTTYSQTNNLTFRANDHRHFCFSLIAVFSIQVRRS